MNTIEHFQKQLLFIFLSFIVLHGCANSQQQRADLDFDTSVPVPSYINDQPVILFDEGHNNFHTTTGLYAPYARLMENDGFHITTLPQRVTVQALEGAAIYVIANARGDGDANDGPAFTNEECKIIRTWIEDGGSMLLIADHYPFGSAAQSLVDEFGIDFQKGMVADSIMYNHASDEDFSQLEFSKANGLLNDHDITRGVSKVITFTGQSIACHDSCFSFLTLSPSAFDMTGIPIIERDGDNTRVRVNYENPVSAAGRSQGIAMQVGKGRIVVLGEAAMLTAQRNRHDQPIGMNNNPGNKTLAMNIMHWLIQR